jgi:hypothetical protein
MPCTLRKYAQRVINAAMIELYWSIGQTISPAATGRTLGE